MNETERNSMIESLGLTYNAVFVPTKQPREEVKYPQLHWKVTLRKGQRAMTIPYHQGCAHLLGYQQFHASEYERCLHDERIRKACETGVFRAKQPVPTLADVLYCLVMDSDCLNMSGFEEWAENYGYDIDSRKAEQTYRQCIDQSLKFKNVIGQTGLDALQEAFQDY